MAPGPVRWRKLGRVYVAQGERPWQQTHAYCPTPVALGEGRLRVFVAFLDAEKVGRVGYVDVDAGDPTRVLAVSDEPVLDIGEPGTFDDNGVTPLSVVRLPDGRLRLYYAGWQLGVRVRYYLFTGAAESDDDGESFTRVSQAPILDRSDGELHVRTGGHVRLDEDGFRMWYAGGGDWRTAPGGGDAKPRYALREIRSADGLDWPRSGTVRLEPLGEDELGFGRPCVLRDAKSGGWRMWYSLRTLSRGYRLGYAESADGEVWERRDADAGLDPSDSGWDSEMVCLSALHQGAETITLFYNGNGYGATGFGAAREPY